MPSPQGSELVLQKNYVLYLNLWGIVQWLVQGLCSTHIDEQKCSHGTQNIAFYVNNSELGKGKVKIIDT